MGTLLLDGVTLIDGSGAAPLADAALVIEDDRIAYAGPRGAAPERAATRRLDGRGLTALPGLIDLHQHSTADADLRAFLARGVTSIRYAGLNQATVRALQGRVAAGELPGPRIFSCGPMLDGDPPSYPEWSSVVETPEAARGEVERLVREEGVDALIATQRITPQVLRAIVETAHVLERPVTGQIHYTDARQAAELGIDGLENTARIYASREYPPERLMRYSSIAERLALYGRAWATIDWELTAPIQEAMARAGVRYCPTLVVTLSLTGELDARLEADPLYALYGEAERATWAAFRARISGTWSAEDRGIWERVRDNQREWIRRYRSLGGRIVAGTDTAFGAVTLPVEIEQLRLAGLSPLESLAAATGGAAEALRRERDFGTLTAGKLADVLVVEGDPLADPAALRRTRHVIKGGALTN